jgi:hypothetical protein
VTSGVSSRQLLELPQLALHGLARRVVVAQSIRSAVQVEESGSRGNGRRRALSPPEASPATTPSRSAPVAEQRVIVERAVLRR